MASTDEQQQQPPGVDLAALTTYLESNRPDLAARLLGEKTPPKENKKEKSDTVQFKPKEKASQNEKRGFFGKKKK